MRNNKTALLFFLALLLRLCTAFSAHHGDLNNNISWGTLAVERGLSGFYGEATSSAYGSADANDWPYSVPNQPPLSILTFATSKLIWQWVEKAAWWLNRNIKVFPSPFIWFWEQRGMDFMVKLPGILADLGIAGLIYQYMRQKKKEGLGFKLTAVWLFNPVTWYVSSVWGQTDSVVNLLGLVAIFCLLNNKLLLFSVFFTLSFLFKGSLIIFAPILIFIVVRQRYSLGELLRATFYSLVTTIGVSVWFYPKADFFSWLVNLYQNRILPGEIGYLTANAFNFWWLVDPGKTLDSTVYFGLPARGWGFGAFFLGTASIILWLRKKITEKKIFLSLVFLSLVSFLFMTRIHERYLYPFFPYATISLGLIPGFWIYYLVLSATYLLNLYHLFWAPSIPFLEALYKVPVFIRLIAVVNLFIFWYIIRHSGTAKKI